MNCNTAFETESEKKLFGSALTQKMCSVELLQLKIYSSIFL